MVSVHRSKRFRGARAVACGLLVATLALTAGPSGSLAKPRATDARSAGTAAATEAKIDVNRAGVRELQALKGVGPALAQRIVAHREKHGAFQKVEDLLLVKGVGPKLLERIRDRVRVGESGGTAKASP